MLAALRALLINDLVGVFQVIKYSFLGINLLQYLNKGPIFVDYLTDNSKNLIISKILNLLKNKFQFFFLKPNLYLNEENILIKYKNKIYYFSPVSYKSSLIDLKLDLEVILKNIDSSWRNYHHCTLFLLSLVLSSQLDISSTLFFHFHWHR